jgi:hypothetical protein
MQPFRGFLQSRNTLLSILYPRFGDEDSLTNIPIRCKQSIANNEAILTFSSPKITGSSSKSKNSDYIIWTTTLCEYSKSKTYFLYQTYLFLYNSFSSILYAASHVKQTPKMNSHVLRTIDNRY